MAAAPQERAAFLHSKAGEIYIHARLFVNGYASSRFIQQLHNAMARKTREEALATRENILDAALACFHENGVAGTTLATIGERAGYSRGAVYWHFKNKSEVLEAMIRRTHMPFLERLRRTASPRREHPRRAALGGSGIRHREWLRGARGAAAALDEFAGPGPGAPGHGRGFLVLRAGAARAGAADGAASGGKDGLPRAARDPACPRTVRVDGALTAGLTRSAPACDRGAGSAIIPP